MRQSERTVLPRDPEAVRRSMAPGPRHYLPTVDVVETEDEVLLLVNMPGVDADKADVSLEAGKLHISGLAELDTVAPEFKPLNLDFGPGHFARSFVVHERVDPEGIRAQMQHGVLRIALPKRKVRSGKQIEVTRE